ncbi:MAG: hypothetical protein CMB37_04410 [Euryarchaeota archaeon]|nr:hypothetical protein [Euryarchaeota archaeon]
MYVAKPIEMPERVVFINAGPIAHFASGDLHKPLTGHAMSSDEQVYASGMGFIIEEGVFSKILDSDEIIAEFGQQNCVDLSGRAIVPGYVDSHSHLLWAGDRSGEMRLRQQGMSYAEIAAEGGGIKFTVDETRRCTDFDTISKDRMNLALSHGTTSIEVKSGYGLETSTELAMLSSYQSIQNYRGMNVTPTWMGAHDYPTEMPRAEYFEQLMSEQLPAVIDQGIAEYVDVFCEPGWYTLEETEEICREAMRHNLKVRLHVDEFTDGEGLQLAAELRAITADHSIHSSDDARAKASAAGVIQGFLPGTPYVMGSDKWPPIQKCIDEDWAWAIATDYNPNCRSLSLPMAGSLITHRLGIDPLAALAAATRNPATGVTRADGLQQGVITEGAVANFNQLKSEFIESWCQSPGHSGIERTWLLK